MVEVAIESLKAVLPEEEILAGSGSYLPTDAETAETAETADGHTAAIAVN